MTINNGENGLISFESIIQATLPEQLDGSEGINREKNKASLISANNDRAAIECWLSEYTMSEETHRNYRKEAERLLLWCIVEKQKPFSSLTGDDLLDYSQFLSDPQPREKWCGPKLSRKGKRWTENWRPFVGPLTAKGKTSAFKALASLFNYLQEVQYLSHNPIVSVRRQIKQERASVEERKLEVFERIIDLDEWKAIQEALENMLENNYDEKWEKVRLKYLISLMYFAGLRNHEVPKHTMGAFKKVRDWQTGKDRWWLYIMGKGNHVAKVPVNSHLLETLVAYRQYLKLPDLPEENETEPLLKSLKTRKPLTTRRINQLIKELTHKAAIKFEKIHPEKAGRLKKFSAHWLRHLHCSMQGYADINRQHIKENARHKNIQTTDIYLHAFDNERHDEMEKLEW